MKKYLLAASFLLSLTPVIASQQPYQEPVNNAQRGRVVVQVVEPTLNIQSVIQLFEANTQNYEFRGSNLFGFGGTNTLKENAIQNVLLPALTQAQQTYTTQLRTYFQNQLQEKQRAHEEEIELLRTKYTRELLAQNELNTKTLVSTQEAMVNMGGVSKALTETQLERDSLRQKVQTLSEELQAATGRASVLKKNEESLLLESEKKDAAALLELARKRLLEEENGNLKRILAELAAKEEEITQLLRENDDNSQSLSIQTGSAEEIEEAQRKIAAVIERNKEKIQTLQKTTIELEKSKLETEKKTRKLQKAIEASDYYTQIANMINKREVSDDDLALFIWSIKTVQGMDLDQLSEGRDERLIVKLIRVSQPYGDRPTEVIKAYEDSFRTLGNLFTPHGLAWVGKSLDYDICRHIGSKFEQTSNTIANFAKNQMSQPEK